MEKPVSVDGLSSHDSQTQPWLSYLNKGGTLGRIRKMKPDQMQAMYRLGYSHFDVGHYAEALRVFRYLALLDHWNANYFLAIGYCLFRLNHYADAIPALSYAERLDVSSPKPSLCMVECFLGLKNRRLAKKSLAEAIKRLNGAEGWEEERHQAAQLKKYFTEPS